MSATHPAVLLPTRRQHNQIAYELLADSFGLLQVAVGRQTSSSPIFSAVMLGQCRPFQVKEVHDAELC